MPLVIFYDSHFFQYKSSSNVLINEKQNARIHIISLLSLFFDILLYIHLNLWLKIEQWIQGWKIHVSENMYQILTVHLISLIANTSDMISDKNLSEYCLQFFGGYWKEVFEKCSSWIKSFSHQNSNVCLFGKWIVLLIFSALPCNYDCWSLCKKIKKMKNITTYSFLFTFS